MGAGAADLSQLDDALALTLDGHAKSDYRRWQRASRACAPSKRKFLQSAKQAPRAALPPLNDALKVEIVQTQGIVMTVGRCNFT